MFCIRHIPHPPALHLDWHAPLDAAQRARQLCHQAHRALREPVGRHACRAGQLRRAAARREARLGELTGRQEHAHPGEHEGGRQQQ